MSGIVNERAIRINMAAGGHHGDVFPAACLPCGARYYLAQGGWGAQPCRLIPNTAVEYAA